MHAMGCFPESKLHNHATEVRHRIRERVRYLIVIMLSAISPASAQSPDSIFTMEPVNVEGARIMHGIGQMIDYEDGIIYAGMKNEILEIDSLNADKAINNTRQILGRIPGIEITENEMGGFTANGIGFRGLNPYQSIETNTRQNGYNISADLYGYNEAYYIPPLEAVKSITILRDGAALSFGPQFGGAVDYQLKDGGEKTIQVNTSQTTGSYGLFNSFNSVGGTINDLKYYGFLQYRHLVGWRANSEQTQWSGFASVKYEPSTDVRADLEYTSLRNLVQMPGGENDSMFHANPRASLRGRNWLESPWNILAAHVDFNVNQNTTLSLLSSYLFSQRNLVWRNEDLPPQVPDTIMSDLAYAPREVEREFFNTFSNELRYLSNYNLSGQSQTFSLGLRYSYSYLIREDGAEGTTGTDFDLATLSPWGQDMNFYTTNVAPYIQNIFRINNRLSITPAIRLEYLETTASGYAENEAGGTGQPYVYTNDEKHARKFLLGAASMEYKTSDATNIYANVSQSYRPITYSNLTPFGSVARIDENLKDASGNDADFGYRGILGDCLNFDLSLFYMRIKNDIGIVEQSEDTLTYQLETNTGADDHKGVEAYIELNVLGGIFQDKSLGLLGIYNSFGYTDARYVSGGFKGNYVPYAPRFTDRLGIDYSLGSFSMNAQYSYTSSCFGDPADTKFSPDGLVGIIPSYEVIDFSASSKILKYEFSLGINNVTDAKYFTMRTDEYPGPGIIPSIGRMVYAGLSGTF